MQIRYLFLYNLVLTESSQAALADLLVVTFLISIPSAGILNLSPGTQESQSVLREPQWSGDPWYSRESRCSGDP